MINALLVTRECDKIINNVSQYTMDKVEKIRDSSETGPWSSGNLWNFSKTNFEFSIILISCSIELSKLFQGVSWDVKGNNSVKRRLRSPWACFSKGQKSFDTRKPVAKFQTLWLQSCFIHLTLNMNWSFRRKLLNWTILPFSSLIATRKQANCELCDILANQSGIQTNFSVQVSLRLSWKSLFMVGTR